MKMYLIFYAASALTQAVLSEGAGDEEDVANQSGPSLTVEDIKGAASQVRHEARGKFKVFLRESDAFNGEVEANTVGGIIIGDSPSNGAIIQAHADVNITLKQLTVEEFKENLEKFDDPDLGEGEGQESEEPLTGDALRAKATELGVQFAANIGDARLQEKVAEAEKEANAA